MLLLRGNTITKFELRSKRLHEMYGVWPPILKPLGGLMPGGGAVLRMKVYQCPSRPFFLWLRSSSISPSCPQHIETLPAPCPFPHRPLSRSNPSWMVLPPKVPLDPRASSSSPSTKLDSPLSSMPPAPAASTQKSPWTSTRPSGLPRAPNS